MIKFIKMKQKEIELKTRIYTYALGILDEKEDIIEIAKNIFEVIKGKSGSDFEQILVTKLAEVIRDNSESAKDEKNAE